MTPAQARDEMFALLRVAWGAGAAAVVGGAYIPVMIWQGQEPSKAPDQGKAYGRATVLHASGSQRSLADETGAKRWDRRGVVMVQCFGPLSGGKGLTIADGLANIALNAYEGKSSPGGAWFRNCRLNEVGASDGLFQINVVAEFQYDEVK